MFRIKLIKNIINEAIDLYYLRLININTNQYDVQNYDEDYETDEDHETDEDNGYGKIIQFITL